jgi:hypothetical protein
LSSYTTPLLHHSSTPTVLVEYDAISMTRQEDR